MSQEGEEEGKKMVSIKLKDAMKIPYEDVRVVTIESKGPVPFDIKKLIRHHHLSWDFDSLRGKLFKLRGYDKTRGLDKFERCELTIISNILSQRMEEENECCIIL